MVNCAIKGCNSSYRKKYRGKNTSFFSFPKNEDLAIQWKIACNIENDSDVRDLRVCSHHFKEDDWSLRNQLLKDVFKPRLKEDAIPSLLLQKYDIETKRTKRMKNKKRKFIVEEYLDEYERAKDTQHEENHIPEEVDSASIIDQLENFMDDKSVQTENDIENAREFHIIKLEKEIRRLKKELDTSQMQLAINCNFEFETTELTQFTKHYAHNHSDKYNNLSDGECDQIDSIRIELKDDFSDSNSNGSVAEIKLCNENVTNIIDSFAEDLLLNESNEIDESTITENNEKSTEILNEGQNTKTSLDFICDLCGKNFSSEENVEKHKKCDHLPFDEFLDSVDVSNVSIAIDPRKCRYCGNRYSRKSQRIIHERIHTGEKPYKCEFCDKRFSCLAHWKRHENLHIGTKPFKCDMCDKSFAQKSYLTIHIQCHKGEKSYACSYCNKTFRQGKSKKIHERVHTGEKPYQCDLCGDCFVATSYLRRHTKKFHLNETENIKPH